MRAFLVGVSGRVNASVVQKSLVRLCRIRTAARWTANSPARRGGAGRHYWPALPELGSGGWGCGTLSPPWVQNVPHPRSRRRRNPPGQPRDREGRPLRDACRAEGQGQTIGYLRHLAAELAIPGHLSSLG
jgi:hypothetical protein